MYRPNKKKIFGSRENRDKQKLGYLQEETLSYYRRVDEAVKEGFGSDEDRNIFLNNTFSQLVQEALEVAQNQTCSRIIECLISQGLSSNLRKLFVALSGDLSVCFLDRFASHVFQTLILHLPGYYASAKPESDEADEKKADGDKEEDISQEKVEATFKAVCEFVKKNLETLLTHTYGSHVLRRLLETLSGVEVASDVYKGKSSQTCKQTNVQQQLKGQVHEDFIDLFNKFAKKLMRICDYEVHLKDASASPVIQTILLIWDKINKDQCQTECKTIMERVKASFPSSETHLEIIPDMASSQVGSHLLELMIKLSSPQILEEMYESLFKGRLLHYGIHPVANYVLQRFVSSLKHKILLEEVFQELSKHMEDIFAVGHIGVAVSLADACRKNQHCQDELVKVLMEVFHCNEPDERQLFLPKLVASFTAYEVFFNVDEGTGKPPEKAEEPQLTSVNLQGSLLLQQLLQFDNPKIVAKGIVRMTAAELSQLCCSPMGSYIVDVFFSSQRVLEKSKDAFLKKLKGLLVDMACSKNGSRCLENVWKNLSIKQRTVVAEELAESSARLRNDRCGHFLHSNFGLVQFVQRRKEWLQHQGGLTKRRRILTEILHRKAPPAKKQKLQKGQKEKHKHVLQVEEAEDQDVTVTFTSSKSKKVKKAKPAGN